MVTIDAIRRLPNDLIKQYLIEALHGNLDGNTKREKVAILRFLADMHLYVTQCEWDGKIDQRAREPDGDSITCTARGEPV
jgi:hypothetical protein